MKKNRFLTKGKLGGSKKLVNDGTWSIFLSIKGTSGALPAKEKAGVQIGPGKPASQHHQE